MNLTMDSLLCRLRPVFALSLAAILAATGCSSITPKVTKTKPAAPTARNYVGDKHMPASLRRVVLIPIYGGEAAPSESAAALDSVFATELDRQMRFEVVTLSREECQRRFNADSLCSADALPNGFLEEIGRDYAAQGVMFVDLTTYHPMRPIALGVRAKLALVDGGRLVWSLDEVYSAESPAVVAGIRKYYASAGGDRGEAPANLPEAALISPSRFGAYAANSAFQTLPPR
jgi:hypothetical protein